MSQPGGQSFGDDQCWRFVPCLETETIALADANWTAAIQDAGWLLSLNMDLNSPSGPSGYASASRSKFLADQLMTAAYTGSYSSAVARANAVQTGFTVADLSNLVSCSNQNRSLITGCLGSLAMTTASLTCGFNGLPNVYMVRGGPALSLTPLGSGRTLIAWCRPYSPT
jgi:hypothetical protein